MKKINRLSSYLYDKEYKIIIKEKSVNIINYEEIIDFNLNYISVKYYNKIISIEGSNLTITKMEKDEILITGNVLSVRIN